MLLVVFYAFVFAITVNESLGCSSGGPWDLRSLTVRKIDIAMRNQSWLSQYFQCQKCDISPSIGR